MEELTIKNVKEKLIEIITEEFLCQLEKNKKHYYNEAQIQHKIGIELYKKFGIEMTVEWGVPHVENDLKSEKRRIDIMLEIGGKKIGIELKYKTKAVVGEEYANDGADNNNKFDFFKDVQRLEDLKEEKDKKFHIEKGFAIFITNDHLYWNPAGKGTLKEAFNLCDGTELSGTYKAGWESRKGKSVEFSGRHKIKWVPPLECPDKKDGKTFRYLIVEV